MITKAMVVDGFEKGYVKIIPALEGDGITAQIGESWLYFGSKAEVSCSSCEEYLRKIPRETIIDEIYSALERHRFVGLVHKEVSDKYSYYKKILSQR